MAKKIDPLQTAIPSKKKNMVIFEVNDKGRGNEFRSKWNWNTDYATLFVSFLESLGFEIESRSEVGNTYINVNGIAFTIDVSNCFYMGKNKWTRETFVRKPENRFIELSAYGAHNVRVHINQEVDADKIKARINKAIADIQKRETDHTAFEQKQKDDALSVARSFITDDVKRLVRQIVIHMGEIAFYIHSGGYVNIKTDGTFKLSLPQYECDEIVGLVSMKRDIDKAWNDLTICGKAITKRFDLSDELIKFVNDTYHKYYNVESDSLTS